MDNSICKYKKHINKEKNRMLDLLHIPKLCKKEETKELKTWGEGLRESKLCSSYGSNLLIITLDIIRLIFKLKI